MSVTFYTTNHFWHHYQNHRCNQQCQAIQGNSERVRQLLRIRALLLSRPAADRQRFQEPEPDSRHLARIGRNEPGHEKERIQILRIDDLLRLLAGHGVRERPPDGLPLQRRPATDGPLSITPPHDRHNRRERSARQGRTIIASPKTSRIRFSPNTLSRYRSMSHCKRRNRKQSV